jgi:hypothetical protein
MGGLTLSITEKSVNHWSEKCFEKSSIFRPELQGFYSDWCSMERRKLNLSVYAYIFSNFLVSRFAWNLHTWTWLAMSAWLSGCAGDLQGRNRVWHFLKYVVLETGFQEFENTWKFKSRRSIWKQDRILKIYFHSKLTNCTSNRYPIPFF